MATVSAYLGFNGHADSDFLSFIFTYPVIYGGRESQVTNNFVTGEVLQNLRAIWPTVLGSDNPIVIGGGADTRRSFMKSRRWQHGEGGLRAANEATWRQAA